MRARLRRGLRESVTVLALLSHPNTSMAFVPRRTSAGTPVHWKRPEIAFTVYRERRRVGLDDAVLRQVLERAASVWGAATIDCTSVRMTVGEIVDARGRVEEDGINAIVFRAQDWCPDGEHRKERCHDPSRVALTSLYTHEGNGASDGEAEEVDIEINAVDFRWTGAWDETVSKRGEHHLAAALVHEFGHAVGFEHSCAARGQLPMLLDDQGRPAPLCAAPTTQSVRSALYPDPEEAGRALVLAPSDDDRRGVCQTYPRPSWIIGLIGRPAPRLAAVAAIVLGLAIALGRGSRFRS